jgi:GxxExxY protein
MRKRRLDVVQQRGLVVVYDDVIVGEFTASLLVEDQVIVELKTVAALAMYTCRNARTICVRRASPSGC